MEAEPGRSVVNRAVAAALACSQRILDERGILVVKDLAAHQIDAPDPALEEALRTVFRALPRRVPEGSTLYVTTRDRAGGDVELCWETRERPAVAAEPDALLKAGAYGDLLGLAVLGLDEICRARRGLAERPDLASPGSSSVLSAEASGKVRRRFHFLIPARRG